jgi:hypothetical protein
VLFTFIVLCFGVHVVLGVAATPTPTTDADEEAESTATTNTVTTDAGGTSDQGKHE